MIACEPVAELLLQRAGTIIDVYPQEDCAHYLVKGYVEQPESGDPMRTDIVLSINDNAVFDCNGEAFPGSTLKSSVLNRWGVLMHAACHTLKTFMARTVA